MAPERQRRVEQLGRAALEREPGLRADFLAEACHGDAELRNDVETLLAQASGIGRGAAGLSANSTTTYVKPGTGWGFPPGTVLAQRYRLATLLGRGGVGEVYRADDLLLDQPVAIKFLSPATTASGRAVSRFRNEVRIARQVTHPNVCRVYDIGEAEGRTYLTMEYIDGEDLASLLRRIGKLPSEKALEIARKLCAGLAAAHERGVVHRDLKPANIMLDGKGHVRITDFGLAGLLEQVQDLHGGTPAYMSPEQRAGRGVTPRSDIYALGIVLHELFTGKRPARENNSGEMEPAVERVIRCCLEHDPRMRPESALSVAAALPGGDPLAVALAAGELPSPELVANAGAIEGLRVPIAVACLAMVVVGLAALCFLRQRLSLVNQIPMEDSPEVLAAKARETAASLLYTDRPLDRLFGWEYDDDYLAFAKTQKSGSATGTGSRFPAPISFWYLESPRYLIDSSGGYMPVRFNRNTLGPGTIAVRLDSEGRLLQFDARPVLSPEGNGWPQPDWARLFAAAGLDSRRFTASQPALTPTGAYDIRAAWKGSWEDGSPDITVEAAAYQGRPVFFRTTGPWTRVRQPAPFLLGGLTTRMVLVFLVLIPIASGLLAWRNTRMGRGDRRGAFRLASFTFFCSLLGSLADADHVPTLTEATVLFTVLRDALVSGIGFWVLYMAFEPQVRRRRPAALVSWSRLLAGRFRDPVVGGDLLIGLALGTAMMCFTEGYLHPRSVLALAPQLPANMAGFFSLWTWEIIQAVGAALSYMFVLTLLTVLLRRPWLASSVFILGLTLVLTPGFGNSFRLVMRELLIIGLVWFALMKFGVLTAVAYAYVHDIALMFPLTTRMSAWYAPGALFPLAIIVVLAVFAFRTTLGGQRLWPDDSYA